MFVTNITFHNETLLHRFFHSMLNGEVVYLKTIQHDAKTVDWGIGHHSIGSSGTYSFTATGLTQPSIVDREQLLLAEATPLQQVGEQWNHQVLVPVPWD